MMNEAGADQVYLACGATDLRKPIDGLTVLIREGFDILDKLLP
jgi:transposase